MFVDAFQEIPLHQEAGRLWWFTIGDQRIQFLRSENVKPSTIVFGRLAVWPRDKSEESKAVERLFRKMEKHFRATGTNTLVVRNTRKVDVGESVRDMWVGPEAAGLLVEGCVVLSQSRAGWVVFEPE